MWTKVDNIITKLPVKFLPPIIGKPNYKTVNDIILFIYVKSAMIPTTLNIGGHGHIGIIINPTIYATIVHTMYVTPDYPVTVTNIPVTVMLTECVQQQYHHTVAEKIY